MDWKRRIINVTSDKKNLQKRAIRIKHSFDEVCRILNSTTKKK